MRVAIIGNFPTDEHQIVGGVEAASLYLVQSLSHIPGLDMHVITINPSSTQYSCTHQGEVTLHQLAGLPRFEFIFKKYKTYQSELNKVLADIQPDLLHAQAASQDAYVALKTGLPSVITVHGIQREDGKYLNNWMLRLRNQIHSSIIEKYNLQNSTNLIAISHYVTDYFSDLLPPDINIFYIPNAINHKYFDLPDKGDQNTVLFMGRVIRRKRLLDLVKAFSKVIYHFPQAKLRVAGEASSDPEYVEEIHTYIQQSNLENNVTFLGSLAEDQVLDEFSQCDILALPSKQETAPMVIAQAMAAGKPVIATAVGGVPEIVSDKETGLLVKVGDIYGLSNNIIKLLSDPPLRKKMGTAGKNKAELNYHADIVAQRTFNVYKEIIFRQ